MCSNAPTPVTARHLRTGVVMHFDSMGAAAREGFSQSCITRCIRGIAKTHAGYAWTTTAKIRPGHVSKYREAIRRLSAEGKSSVQIAAELGCSTSTVNYNLGLKV